MVCAWLGIDLRGLPDYLSTDPCPSLEGLLTARLDAPIPQEEQERFYQNFQYYYKRACIGRFGEGTPELKRALSIRKGKTQRKLTINSSLAALDLPYRLVKRKKCWVLERVWEE